MYYEENNMQISFSSFSKWRVISLFETRGCFTFDKSGRLSNKHIQTLIPSQPSWQHCHILVCYTNAGHHHPSLEQAKHHPFMARGGRRGEEGFNPRRTQDKVHTSTKTKPSSLFKSHIYKTNEKKGVKHLDVRQHRVLTWSPPATTLVRPEQHGHSAK